MLLADFNELRIRWAIPMEGDREFRLDSIANARWMRRCRIKVRIVYEVDR